MEAIEVMSFDQSAAGRFAVVAAAWARRGEPIGTFDTRMAAHALSLRLTFRHQQYPALHTRPGARDRELGLMPWAAEQQA